MPWDSLLLPDRRSNEWWGVGGGGGVGFLGGEPREAKKNATVVL